MNFFTEEIEIKDIVATVYMYNVVQIEVSLCIHGTGQ